MALTKEQVRHIAKLARLTLSDEEIEKNTQQLSSILEYIEQLHKVDTVGINVCYQVPGLEQVLAKDEVQGCDSAVRDGLMAAMPDRVGEVLKVKGVFGE